MRRFQVIAFCLLSALQLSAKDSKMNVLMIAIDDLANAIASAGHPVVKTPNLDALAASGVRFDRAYCQLPLCNPSRASVLTGIRPDVTKVYDLSRHFRDELPEVVTLPQLFRNNGWFVARVGKLYHYNVPFGIGGNGLDDEPSWDEVVNPKGRDVADEALIFNAEPHRPISGALSWLAADGTDEEQTDGMIATEAIRLMEAHRDHAFFIGAGFFRPHTPYVAPKKYFDMYPLESIQLPEAPEGDREDIPKAAFAHNCPVPNYNLPEEVCREALQAYYANVSFVDAQVGRLMTALDDLRRSGTCRQDHGRVVERSRLPSRRAPWRLAEAHAFRTECTGAHDDPLARRRRQWHGEHRDRRVHRPVSNHRRGLRSSGSADRSGAQPASVAG
jgi:uncharacterized sulfatase